MLRIVTRQEAFVQFIHLLGFEDHNIKISSSPCILYLVLKIFFWMAAVHDRDERNSIIGAIFNPKVCYRTTEENCNLHSLVGK